MIPNILGRTCTGQVTEVYGGKLPVRNKFILDEICMC